MLVRLLFATKVRLRTDGGGFPKWGFEGNGEVNVGRVEMNKDCEEDWVKLKLRASMNAK